MERIYGIDRAVKHAGSIEQLGVLLGVTAATIKQWRRKSPETALKRAVGCLGTQAALALALETAQTTVSLWMRSDCPPADDVEPKNGIERAVRLAGSQAALARRLGVRQPSVNQWVQQGYAPLRRAQEIELQYGVPRAEIMSPEMRDVMGVGGEL